MWNFSTACPFLFVSLFYISWHRCKEESKEHLLKEHFLIFDWLKEQFHSSFIPEDNSTLNIRVWPWILVFRNKVLQFYLLLLYWYIAVNSIFLRRDYNYFMIFHKLYYYSDNESCVLMIMDAGADWMLQ